MKIKYHIKVIFRKLLTNLYLNRTIVSVWYDVNVHCSVYNMHKSRLCAFAELEKISRVRCNSTVYTEVLITTAIVPIDE